MKNVIELIRVSTERQAEGDRGGIPAQREANRRTAKAHDLHITETVEIVDVSDASVMASPEMRKLLRLIKSPEIHGVVAKEFSRLMRPDNFADFVLLQSFADTGTILYFPEGPIDLASKGGRLIGTIRAAVAGLERREITERMQDAKEALRRAGRHPGGVSSLPYGVGYSKECGWHYTPEIEKVKQAFARFSSGQTSYTEIGRRLNIPRTSVRFILENPIYTGWRVYDKRRDSSLAGYVARPDGRQGYRRKVKRSPEDVIRVRVLDPIVSEDEFARVNRMMTLKRQKHWRAFKEPRNRYTYNGFLVCEECRNPLYTHSSQQDFYICKTRHTRERRKRALEGLRPCTNKYMLRSKLEGKIDELLGRKVLEPEFLERLADDYNDQIVQSRTAALAKADERTLTTKLGALEEKRKRVLDGFFEGVIDGQERNRRLETIEHDRDAYQRMLMEAVLIPSELTGDDLEQVFEPLAEWEFLERDDKRALLTEICPVIGVFRYRISTISLNVKGYQSVGGDEGSRSKTGK